MPRSVPGTDANVCAVKCVRQSNVSEQKGDKDSKQRCRSNQIPTASVEQKTEEEKRARDRQTRRGKAHAEGGLGLVSDEAAYGGSVCLSVQRACKKMGTWINQDRPNGGRGAISPGGRSQSSWVRPTKVSHSVHQLRKRVQAPGSGRTRRNETRGREGMTRREVGGARYQGVQGAKGRRGVGCAPKVAWSGQLETSDPRPPLRDSSLFCGRPRGV
ncbi:hypothetical protein ANO11243_051900 [Dothideomycetidae sp. 11243]|nr:hypothetical protein ANO11243_051900 [fungal sp. No.11243]